MVRMLLLKDEGKKRRREKATTRSSDEEEPSRATKPHLPYLDTTVFAFVMAFAAMRAVGVGRAIGAKGTGAVDFAGELRTALIVPVSAVLLRDLIEPAAKRYGDRVATAVLVIVLLTVPLTLAVSCALTVTVVNWARGADSSRRPRDADAAALPEASKCGRVRVVYVVPARGWAQQ